MTIDESRRQFVRVRWKTCRRGICLWSHDLSRSLFFKCTWFCKSGYTLIHILNDFADYLLGSCLFLANVSEFPSLTYWDESSGRVTGVFPREPFASPLPLWLWMACQNVHPTRWQRSTSSESFLPLSGIRDKNNSFNVKKHTGTIFLATFLQ